MCSFGLPRMKEIVTIPLESKGSSRELEHLTHKEKLRQLGMICLEKKRLTGQLIAVLHYLKVVTEKMELFRGAQLKVKSQQFQVCNKGGSNST